MMLLQNPEQAVSS